MSKNNDRRRDEITKIVLSKEKVKVEELAHTLQVTPETIRSDLTFLEAKGIVYRTHGGATLRNSNADIPMDIRVRERSDKKRSIAYAAINYINDDETIFIDPSSTALPLGRLLRLRKNLTIVTTSYELLPILSESAHKILFAGGEYCKAGKRTFGPYAIDMLDSIHYDTSIFGMDGCAFVDAPCNADYNDSIIAKHILQRSTRSILLSDSSKFSTKASYQYASFSDFDLMVCDEISSEDRARICVSRIIEARDNN